MFPQGVLAFGEACALIVAGKAPHIVQSEQGASYDPMWNNHEKAKINFKLTGQQIHNFIRGSDSVPGAWTLLNEEKVTLFGSTMNIKVQPQPNETNQVKKQKHNQQYFLSNFCLYEHT
jgi:formyltetrahydrofolate dehydrogenase